MVLRKNKVVLWMFVGVFLMAVTALFAENCWQIYWPYCDEVFNGGEQVDDGCADKCGTDFGYNSECEYKTGYTDWPVPYPFCSESGYWDYAQESFLTTCAQKHQCYTTEYDCPDPPGTLWDYYLCGEGESAGYTYTDVNFYGIDFSCGEED